MWFRAPASNVLHSRMGGITRAARVIVASTLALVCSSSCSPSSAPGEGSAPGVPTSPPRGGRPGSVNAGLGYNLDLPGDWTNLPPFIDQVKNGRAPAGDCSDTDAECDPVAHLSLDERGWVTTLDYADDPELAYEGVRWIINSSSERSDIGERFVVTWEGTGRVGVDNALDVERDEAARRLTFTLQAGDTSLRVTDIDPEGTGDYVRNVRVFRAEFEDELEAGEVWNPEVLEFLAPFRSLRFMDWMESNALGKCSGGPTPGAGCYAVVSPECGEGGRCLMPGHWEERPTTDGVSLIASSQFLDVRAPELGTRVGGYPLETMIALANRLGADPHFNVPVDADDDYIESFARLLSRELDDGLTATIEYSNEVWNFGFPQADYANAKGRALWPDEGTAWLQYMAGRANQMCGIIKGVFAGEEGRVRCIIAPQTGWRQVAETVLDCPAWAADHPDGGPCSSNVDAIGITGYFAGCLPENEPILGEWLDEGRAAALDLAFEQLEHGGLIEDCTEDGESTLDATIDTYGFFAELARARGLELYAYESGSHFSYDSDGALRSLFVDMSHDPRMRELYLRNFSAFNDAGGTLMNVWGWVAPDDMWANADSLSDRAHPKYEAILEFTGER